MAIEVIAWAMQAPIASHGAKLTLIALANYANDKGLAWPGQDTLRTIVQADRKSIIRWLQQLAAAGYITKTSRGGDGHGRLSNAYALHYHGPGNVPTAPHADPPNPLNAKSQPGPGKVPPPPPGQSPTAVPAKSPPDPGKVPAAPPKPSEEPSEQPSARECALRAPAGRPAAGSTPGFDRFWATWPSGQRKRGRKTALTVWRGHHLEPLTDMIVADVQHRSQADDWWLRGYAPMPATYLRGARWEDELGGRPSQRELSPSLRGILSLEKYKCPSPRPGSAT